MATVPSESVMLKPMLILPIIHFLATEVIMALSLPTIPWESVMLKPIMDLVDRAGYSGYYGYAPVYHTLGKRDAEANYGYSGYRAGYSGYYGFVPAYHTLGKRDADAQQKISYIYGAPGYYGYYGYAFPRGY